MGDRKERRTREEEASATATKEWEDESCRHLQKSLPLRTVCAAGIDFPGET